MPMLGGLKPTVDSTWLNSFFIGSRCEEWKAVAAGNTFDTILSYVFM